MTTFKRYIGGLPVAAAVTLGLGVIMAGLIRHDGPPPTEGERIVMAEINAIPEDIIPDRNRDLPILRIVDTPPPPPVFDIPSAKLPDEPIAKSPDAFTDFKKPVMIKTTFNIVPTDGDEQPIVRIPPAMPPRAERSGHCVMQFDVSAEGSPYNVTAQSCSQNLFQRSSVKSVQQWKYKPKIRNGSPVARTGLRTTITFALTDERGNVIAE